MQFFLSLSSPGLQTNFYITYMRETFNKLGSPKMKGCSKHAQQPMSFFCKKCGFAICRDCTVLDHRDADGHAIQVCVRCACVCVRRPGVRVVCA